MKNDPETRRKIDAWFDLHTDELIKDVGKLITIMSVNGEALPGKPYGEGPAAALGIASEILHSKGFEVENFENHVITADLNEAEPVLGILAHLDIVTVGEGWSSDPFTLTIRDGVLYGRGVTDNKGPAVAAIYALSAVRELAPALTKGCRLVLGSAEEIGHSDLTFYRKSKKMPPNVLTPDSSYPVVNLEKGRLKPIFGASWIESKALPRVVSIKGGQTANVVPNHAEAVVDGLPLSYIQALCVVTATKTGATIKAAAYHDGVKITALGRSAHAMSPHEGLNAQTALLTVLAELPLAENDSMRYIKKLAKLFPHGDTSGKALGIAMQDDISGALTLNFGVLSFGTVDFTANFDCRSPKCATKENLDDIALQALNDAGITVSEIDKTLCHHTPEASPFVQTLLKIYEQYTGNKGTCLAFGGQTYVHDIDGGVAFGPAFPGTDNRIHGANEYIGIKDLINSAKMFAQVILDMCE